MRPAHAPDAVESRSPVRGVARRGWREMDLERWKWRIPADRMKDTPGAPGSGTRAARARPQEAQRIADGSGLVFPPRARPPSLG